jgi:hypothetical protein
MTVEVEAHPFARGLGVSLRCGALGIRAEYPDLPRDRAVVRVERQVRDVFPLGGSRQGGGRWSRKIQVEENFPFHRVVFQLFMNVVRRSEVWREFERLRGIRGGWALMRKGTIWGRVLRGSSSDGLMGSRVHGTTTIHEGLTWSGGAGAGAGGPGIDLSWDDLMEVLSSESGMIMMGVRRDATDETSTPSRGE